MKYNVAYDVPSGTRRYCLCNMPLAEAERQLASFKRRYFNADGTPRPYPNGKGIYPFSNPRIVRV